MGITSNSPGRIYSIGPNQLSKVFWFPVTIQSTSSMIVWPLRYSAAIMAGTRRSNLKHCRIVTIFKYNLRWICDNLEILAGWWSIAFADNWWYQDPYPFEQKLKSRPKHLNRTSELTLVKNQNEFKKLSKNMENRHWFIITAESFRRWIKR